MNKFDALLFTFTSKTQQIGRQWRRLVRDIVTAHGVSEACSLPLITISRSGGGINQIAVADEIGIEGASLVRLLDQLAASGLIERREGIDRRSKTLWLTPLGEDVTLQIENELIALRHKVFGHLDPGHIETALSVFAAIDSAVAAQQKEAVSS